MNKVLADIYTKVIAIFTVVLAILGYLALAKETQLFPFSSPASAVQAGYQGTWNGSLDFPMGSSVPVKMTLGPAAPHGEVGEMDVSGGCQTELFLEHGGSRIELKLIIGKSDTSGICSIFSDLGISFSAYLGVSLAKDGSLEASLVTMPGAPALASGSLTRAS